MLVFPIRLIFLTGALSCAGLLGCGGPSSNPGAETGNGSGSGSMGGTGSAGAASGGSGNAASGASGTSGGSGGASGASTTPAHRPAATACPTTTFAGPGQDAGSMSCTADSDCAGDSGYSLLRYCLDHVCGADQCLADSDCAAGSACGCAPEFPGQLLHGNMCVPTGCHVDSDCPSGLCSPAGGGNLCVPFSGYRCRSAADTCASDSDCGSTSDGGISLPSSCSYEPTSGHWQCVPACLVSG